MKDFIVRCARTLKELALGALRTVARGVAQSARFLWSVVSAPSVRSAVHRLLAFQASLARVALAASLLAAVGFLVVWLGYERIPLGAIGVRQTQWGDAGIEPRDFEPGMHASLRFFQSWHRLDGRTHLLAFGFPTDGCELPVLDLRTKDGNEVKVSVTVPYHIRRGEGWQLVRDGLKSSYRDLARTTTESALMQELAHLSSTEFADTAVRSQRCADALPQLNELLRPYHLEAESIQIHQTQFWIEYEKKLQQKQLTHQEALEAGAATEVEEERGRDTLAREIDAEEKRVAAEMDKLIETENATAQLAIAGVRAQAKSYDDAKRAEADALYQREMAAGELALTKAEALRDRLKHETYESSGGRILLARAAAANLRISHVTLDAHDPRVPTMLDLDALVALLIGKRAVER